MTKNKFIEIQTKRLTLRKLKAIDWEMISFLRSDRGVNKFIARPAAKTKEEALQFITNINDQVENSVLFYWAITKNGTDKMIGTICIWNFSRDQKTAEVGFDLSPSFQGNGIMSEAIKPVLKHGFQCLKLDLLMAYTHGNNVNAKKILEKNKFTLVENITDNHRLGHVVYGLRKNAFK